MTGPTSLLLVSVAVPVIGFLAGAAARLGIARFRPPRLSWAASTLCGITGAALGSSLVAIVAGRPVRELPVAVVLGGLVGTVVLVAGADQLAQRRAVPPPSASELIRAGESSQVEFKSSARFNRHTRVRDARLEIVVAAAVAAFLNGRGGTLLIGVADDGSVAGLDDDYGLVKDRSRDRYELWLRDLLTTTIGAPAAASVIVDFERIDQQEICLLRVRPAGRPVFLRAAKQRSTAFFVRVGNSTRELDAGEMLEYAVGRWSLHALGGRVWRRRPARIESWAPRRKAAMRETRDVTPLPAEQD
ncbi:MAG: hypothetical protein QOH29_574 [Actinomycetota bacterium]|jgi:hypothetical protein|nr:hypothetical protein [Jatrophihabitans sp.]MDQ1539848.1 hypothetical protein [Actinomycetota bacterium]